MNRKPLQIGSLTGATGAALGSAAASICCVGPIALTLLGVQGAIFAAGIKPYRYWLLGAALLFIGTAVLLVYRPLRTKETSCPVRVGRVTRVVLWLATGVWAASLGLNLVIDYFGL